MTRMFVTGPTGSGKTTLARNIATQAGLRLHSLDDIHWVRNPDGDQRRASDERAALLDQVVRQEAWVVEGVQFKWADAAMDRAHHILVLDLPRWRNLSRIVRRFLGRRFSSTPDRRGNITALREEFQWSKDYYESERQLLFTKLKQWQGKVIVARDSRSALFAIHAELRLIKDEPA